MNRLPGIGVCAALVLLSVGSMRAQDNNLPAVPKRKFRHNARIVSVYDEEKKQTVVRTQWHVSEGIMNPRSLNAKGDRFNAGASDPHSVVGGGPESLEIIAGFAYAGRVLTSTPEAVEFVMRVAHQGVPLFKGDKMPELIAVKDGK